MPSKRNLIVEFAEAQGILRRIPTNNLITKYSSGKRMSNMNDRKSPNGEWRPEQNRLGQPSRGVAILWKLKSAIPDGNAEEFENSKSYRGRVSILQDESSKAVPKDLYNISS